jgi:mannose-6-phosphate isomerase-like protein (cupin superfamily)
MALTEFFEPDRTEADRVFYRAEDLTDLTSLIGTAIDGGRPQIVLKQVGDARAHNLQIMHERYAPGADTGVTLLEHNAHEGGVVVSGQIEVTVGSHRQILCAGEAYIFDSRVPHRFRNISNADAIVISACTPPYL